MHATFRRSRSCSLVVGLLLPLATGNLCAQPEHVTRTLQERIQKALARSRPALREHLRSANGGVLALLCLAAVHDDIPASDPVFGPALQRLKNSRLAGSYQLALRLMVMAEMPEFPNRHKYAVRDARRLLGNQGCPGGFTYNANNRSWDLSNTQYAVLGLRAAASIGVKIERRQWKDIARTVITAQFDDGGFGYSTATQNRGGRGAYSSMTAAGLAVLAICMQNLDDATIRDLELHRRLAQAWDWMADHNGDIGKEGVRSCAYFHYGLERACILGDVIKIGGKNWYEAGASMLLELQDRGGGWTTNDHGAGQRGEGGVGSPVSTAFAILFLERKFQKQAGPITPGGSRRIAGLGPQATRKQVDTAIDTEVLVGRRAVPGLLKLLRSPIEVRRKAATHALIKITGQDFGINPHAQPSQNAEAIKSAERWWLKNRDNG